ncbi:hypothetical protein M408DRAFT_29896 [Serendipita vermifera MAFF 305830]|uniref:F-box domain-containing protein n=1 Tax=Serendipita vermifera MAFF 305830 TaxID=933852 RepID=A0A0C3ANZ7_SERVB|nr:hypothetical protein M408DRAFT_29896 [Serendipita vermifera MAFF 305830]
MVSRKWKEVLMRIQTLWAYLNIKESDEDSAATIALFLHLSGKARLSLTISIPLSGHWDAIRSLLLPHSARICNIILLSHKDSHMPYCEYNGASDWDNVELGRVLKHVIIKLGLLTTMQNFQVTSDIPLRPEMLLPSSARRSI